MFRVFGLAEYGTREILLAFFITAVLCAILSFLKVPWLCILPFAVFCWVLYFFRDPVRIPPENPAAILSPADGHVTHIEEVEEKEFIKGKALMVGIFLSVFDVHLNRAPFPGRVEYIKYRPGKFHDARDEKSTTENEANSIGFSTDHEKANNILVKQIAGLIARRIVCDCEVGDTVKPADKLGMIKFGSRTEIYIPIEAAIDIKVKVGDKVSAGTTILGELK